LPNRCGVGTLVMAKAGVLIVGYAESLLELSKTVFL
jgi:hypothetical protein